VKLPRFVPILTTFTARVAGRDLAGLLQSPTALARALADTQTVVGHDGVLCLFDPDLVATACTGASAEVPGLESGDAAAVLRTPPLATLLESIQPLKHHLQGRARVIFTIAGPALLQAQLQKSLQSAGGEGRVDPDYVIGLIRDTVRSALESGADGIALIEQTACDNPEDFSRCYKAVRKLADFYDAAYLAFLPPGSGVQQPGLLAHCVFDLNARDNDPGPVSGKPGRGIVSDVVTFTTAGDVPGSATVEELKALWRNLSAA